MTKHHFSFQEVFTFGWAKTRQHAWFIFLTFIIGSIIMGAVLKHPLINLMVGLMVGISIASISLIISRDRSFSFADLFTPMLSPHRVLKFFALVAFFSVPVLVTFASFAIFMTGASVGNMSVSSFGLILLVLLLIPTIFISVRFKFFPYVLLDNEHASVKDLIKMSYKLTANHFWILLAFLITCSLINVVGILFFGIGLFVTVPLTVLALAHVYNKLKEHSM
jgi:uncharacterized membrane protein